MCVALAVGCGDDGTAPGSDAADVSAVDDAAGGGGGDPVDASVGDDDGGGGADVAQDSAPGDADASLPIEDAGDGGRSDAAAPDAGPEDAASPDAPTPDVGGGDAAPGCTPGGELACVSPCVFSFTSLDEDREGLRVVTVEASGGGPVSLTGIRLDEVSPLAGFSSGWIRYIERITGDDWALADGGRSLDTAGTALELPEGSLEIELRFEATDGEPSAGCPSGRRDRCGEVVVDWVSCDGEAGAPVRIPVRR